MPHNLDPLRAIVSTIGSSDVLLRAANAAGLRFDLNLTDADDYSNLTRVRALVPRMFTAYDGLTDQERIIAAQATFGSLVNQADAEAALGRVGWIVNNGELAVSTPELREVFFPKGSQWDAFVVLRTIFGEAAGEILIVDSYCDGTVFQMLATRDLAALRVRILCSRYAAAVRAEGNRFTQQHPGVAIEVRQTRDFHDRFVVLDGARCVHVGASLNAAGNTAFMVSKVEDADNTAALLAQIQASWDNGTVVP